MFTSVELYGCHSGSCGYCKNNRHDSYYTRTDKLLSGDYKILMDSGWRRCGYQVYKFYNSRNCCPAYTIRCDAENFRISKAQKKVLQTVNAFLATGKRPYPNKLASNSTSNDCRGDYPERLNEPRKDPSKVNNLPCSSFKPPNPESVTPNHSKRSGSARQKRWLNLQERMRKRAESLDIPYEDVYQEYILRRKKRMEKNKPKELEELLCKGIPQSGSAHFIDVRLCRSSPMSEEINLTLDAEFKLYKAYQINIHGDRPEEISMMSFKRFLVNSPLMNEYDERVFESAGAPTFGSYHQQYWLDGERLIAVGVIDLVPGCLSSVYLFYDPEYAFLHLGTYTALREIAFVRHLHRTYGEVVPAYADFTQYYMGYYIHSCIKMRYKGAFSPSYLACPETYAWVPIERCRALLDANKYSRLAQNKGDGTQEEQQPEQLSPDSVNSIVVMLSDDRAIRHLLDTSEYSIENGKLVTTVGVASRFLSSWVIEAIRSWRELVPSTGRMRLDFSK